MYNKVFLLGNLTRDVELKSLPSGTFLATSAIATNRRYKDSMGNDKEEILFIDFTLFGRSAEVAHQYLRKGSTVMIEGRLVLDQWTDQNGQKRSRHSIVVDSFKMLDRKSDVENANTITRTVPPKTINKSTSEDVDISDTSVIEDKDIPF